MTSTEIARVSGAIVREVERAIVGKKDVIEGAVLALLCGGHVLIEDVPGVGKTTLAKALAMSMQAEFSRIQFTPDLLPSDITGTSIYRQDEGEFIFQPGPLFANVVLVDEINRATPKTQSALLEAMEEQQITVDGKTRTLKAPFFVLATQNNIEMTGTYPLPEAQLDRFFARIRIGYPGRDAESAILAGQQISTPIDDINGVVTPQEMLDAQKAVREINVHESIRDYIVDIIRATRESSQLSLGSSPRGSLNLMTAAQAHAAMNELDFVRPDDVKAVAPMVLGHRLMVRGEVRARGTTGEDIVSQVMEATPAPQPAPATA